MKPVIIDCDPGYDDAVALVLALANEKLDVKAITATAGNQTIDKTYKNAVRICDFLNKDIRIGKGVEAPLVRELETAPEVHGSTGLDGPNIPQDVNMPKLENSIDVMRDVIENSDEKVTLIAIGPLTNVALFLIAHPELKEKIEEIVIMGGAAYVGNRTSSAEFNIIVDAEAAEVVFKSGVPIIMAGLDVTHKSQIMTTEFKDIEAIGPVGKFTSEVLEYYHNFYKKLGASFDGPPVHDLCAVAYVINPELFSGEWYHVDVECKGEYTYGRTVVDFMGYHADDKNTKVLFDMDRVQLLDMLKEAIKTY